MSQDRIIKALQQAIQNVDDAKRYHEEQQALAAQKYSGPHLLTVEQLNKRSGCGIFLQMLRCLVTSDLAFTYMLFKSATLTDICNQALSMLQMELEQNCHHMTVAEHAEYHHHISTLSEYARKYAESEKD